MNADATKRYHTAIQTAASQESESEHPDDTMERYGKIAKRFSLTLGDVVGDVGDELNKRPAKGGR